MDIIKVKNIFENEIGIAEIISEIQTDSSHSNFAIIECEDGKKYMCKEVYDKTLAGSDKCIVYEFKAQNLANKLNLAPRAVLCNEELNIIISDYIDCVPFYDISLKGVIERARLAKQLISADYEHSDFEIKHCDYVRDFDSHLFLLENALKYIENASDSAFYNEISEFKELVISIKSKCLSVQNELNKYDYVLSHNDLVAGNVLLDSFGKKYMIDFETVGLTKLDFIMGQLAVDAEIDWYLNNVKSSKLMELYDCLNAVFDRNISYNIFIARVLERHIQNICYGYRQISISVIRKYPTEYINQKRSVVCFCKKRIHDIEGDLQ